MESNKSASELQGSVYDEGYQGIVELKDSKLKEMISKITHEGSCRILDVGCGDGRLLQNFCSANECYGVDFSEAQLEKARAKKIITYRLDMESERFPFANDFFDVVICSETIEHLLDTDNIFYEINRVLKPNRIFILTFPNINQPISWLMQIFYDLPPVYSARYKAPHVRDFTLRIVRSALANFGFKIIDVRGTYIYPNKTRFSQWLANCFPRLSEKIIILSTKKQHATWNTGKKVVWNVMELFAKPKSDS